MGDIFMFLAAESVVHLFRLLKIIAIFRTIFIVTRYCYRQGRGLGRTWSRLIRITAVADPSPPRHCRTGLPRT